MGADQRSLGNFLGECSTSQIAQSCRSSTHLILIGRYLGYPKRIRNLVFNCKVTLIFQCLLRPGIVQSSFWIHVSHTNGRLNPPLRPSDRQGSNVIQMREGFLVWVELDPRLYGGLSGRLNPSLVWLT